MKTSKHQQHAQQQGFVLALALLLMLFIGVIVISSAQKTGVETRTAQSEVSIATLQAAAEAGIYRFRQQAYKELKENPENSESEESACNHIENKSEGNNLANFLDHSGKGAEAASAVPFISEEGANVYWYLDESKMDYKCSVSDANIAIHSIAFAGSPDHKIAKVELTATMGFEEDQTGGGGQNGGQNDGPDSDTSDSGSEAVNNVRPPELIDALGRFADYTVAVGGSFTANGARTFEGKIGSGGAMDLNGSITINGSNNHSEETETISDWATMPDPRSTAPGWPHFTGYIDSIADRAATEDDVVETCDLSSINSSNNASAGKRYVYCNGNFSSQGNRGTLHSNLDNMILVAQGNFDGRIGDSIHVSIVTGGTVNLGGAGNDSLKSGVIWSAGSVALSGGPNFNNLGLITNSALTINGAGNHSGPGGSGGSEVGEPEDPGSSTYVPSTSIQFEFDY